MSLIDKALEIAISAHKDQVDKAGRPYILHVLRVMSNVETDEEKAVAILHDVFEDSPDLDLDKTLRYRFPVLVYNAVELLTRQRYEMYEDYIKIRVKTNKIATTVKIADLKDNMDMSRLRETNKKDLERFNKYHWALLYLTK